MPLATWLFAMVSPLVAKILLSLGFSVVTIVGMDAVLNTLKTMFVTQANLMPAAALQLALLGGAGEGIGIIFGAITTRLLLWQISKATRILGANTGS